MHAAGLVRSRHGYDDGYGPVAVVQVCGKLSFSMHELYGGFWEVRQMAMDPEPTAGQFPKAVIDSQLGLLTVQRESLENSSTTWSQL